MSQSPAQPALTVAILAYNEVQNLRPVVAEIVQTLETLPAPWEMLVIDDGSTDGTGALADELAAGDPRLRVVHHGHNRGLGGVYQTGFDMARGEFLTFYPADGQFPPDIIATFFGQMGDLDLLLGYLPTQHRTLAAQGASLAERWLYRVLVGPMPKFQGVLMLRTAVLRQVPLVSSGRGWGIVMELVLRVARGPYRVRSTPTAMRPRLAGQSKVMNVRTVVANMKQLLGLRRALSRTAPPTR